MLINTFRVPGFFLFNSSMAFTPVGGWKWQLLCVKQQLKPASFDKSLVFTVADRCRSNPSNDIHTAISLNKGKALF